MVLTGKGRGGPRAGENCRGGLQGRRGVSLNRSSILVLGELSAFSDSVREIRGTGR